MTLWEVDIYPGPGQPDLAAKSISADAADMGLCEQLKLASARGFLVQGDLDESQIAKLSEELFADQVVERTVAAAAGDQRLPERVEPAQVQPAGLQVVLERALGARGERLARGVLGEQVAADGHGRHRARVHGPHGHGPGAALVVPDGGHTGTKQEIAAS